LQTKVRGEEGGKKWILKKAKRIGDLKKTSAYISLTGLNRNPPYQAEIASRDKRVLSKPEYDVRRNALY